MESSKTGCCFTWPGKCDTAHWPPRAKSASGSDRAKHAAVLETFGKGWRVRPAPGSGRATLFAPLVDSPAHRSVQDLSTILWMRARGSGNKAGEGVRYKRRLVGGVRPRAVRGAGILVLGKPCKRPKSAAGGRPIVLRLIWSAGAWVVPFTFVPVSARVPACQQTTRRWVLEDPLRVVEPLAVWTLPRSPDSNGCGLLTYETVFVVGRRPSATHPTSGVGGEPKLAGQTGGNGGKPAEF
jgi:hypothetical protein